MKRLLVLSLFACGGPQPPTAAPPPPHSEARLMPPMPPPKPIGHPSANLIPRSVLFGAPERAQVELSPDGKQLSWLAPVDGVLNIWVAPIDKLDQAKPVTHETTRPIRTYDWAFTNKHLLYNQDVGGDENFHVFRVDLASGKTADLTPYPKAHAELVKLGAQQPGMAIVLINDRDPKAFDVYKIDLATAKRTLMLQNDQGFGEFTFGDDLALRVAHKKLPDGSSELLVPDGKGWKSFDTIPFEDSETTEVVGIAPSGKALYVRDSRSRDTAALVSIDLATKKPTMLAEDDKSDAGEVILHPTKHAIQAVAFDYDRVHWKVLDPSIQKDLDALGKLDLGADVKINSRSLDDRAWIVVTTSEKHPGRFYLWDRAKQASTFLFASRPELEKQPLVAMHPVTIHASDGLELVGYLSLPITGDPDEDGTPDHTVPMVLFVHGGPWARDEWGFSRYHQLLANRGYAVLSVNFRGSTGFGKKFLNAGNLEWGKAMHQDLIDAVQWAIDRKIAPRDKIAIAGGSYGGYATLAGLTMTPDVFACGVDIVGPSNLETLLASIPPYWAPLVAMFKKRIGDFDTEEGKALLKAASPLTHAKHIRHSLLIGQGANDPRVKQAESEQIVAAMKQHHLPVTYVVFPDEGHGFQRPANNIAFTGVMEAFLSAHLDGEYLPLTPEEIKASTMDIKEGKDGIPGL